MIDTWLASPYLLLFARLTLGGVFVLGAVGKWLDPAGAEAALRKRPWMPAGLARLGARGMPLVEALVGALLLLGLALQPAALAAAALLLVFTATVVADLRQGTATACHCFGRFSNEQVSPATLVRNGVLIVLAALLVWHPTPYVALDALWAAGAGVLPPLVNAVPVVFLAVIVVVAIVVGRIFVETIRGFLRAF
ncbi:MAG TPA: MauE/DoxX family redox-associated membrane protein [Chloroflexia bacterium]|nr:MauE/DoxX family redox-associated membrane protein [Chloroflexia bacterium]